MNPYYPPPGFGPHDYYPPPDAGVPNPPQLAHPVPHGTYPGYPPRGGEYGDPRLPENCSMGLLGREQTKQGGNGQTALISLQPVPGDHSRTEATLLSLEDTQGNIHSPNPHTTTLCLYRKNMVTQAQIPVGTNQRIKAEVIWGQGKSKQDAIIDFHHGTRLTLDAQIVQVRAFAEGTITLEVQTGYVVQVSAGLVYGGVSGHQTTFTDDRVAVDIGAASAFRLIPKWARSMIVYSSDPTNLFANVIVTSDAKGTGDELNVSVEIGAAGGEGLTIPNGMEGYAIENPAGSAADADFQAVFPLYL